MAVNARRIGRPGQAAAEDLQRHILEIARQQFVADGYAGTSLEQIAAVAGSGKQTLYRHFSSKEGLFLAVMRSETARLNEIAAAAEAKTTEPLDALRQCSRLLFDFALTDGMISLSRILIAEAARFPELGGYVFETCLAPFKTRILRLFDAAQATGALTVIDPDLSFDLLRGVLLGTPVQRLLLGPSAFGEPAARDRYFATAWELFLKGSA